MQKGLQIDDVILCINEDETSIKVDTPAEQNKLAFESLKFKTVTQLLCLSDPCWLYLRWTIFIFGWLLWLASWMIRT